MGRNLMALLAADFGSDFGANDRMLALTDPALAAAIGATSGDDFGSDGFGDEADVGLDLSPDVNGFGFGFGYDNFFGADAVPAKPTAPQAIAAWQTLRAQKVKGMQRMQKLDPNMGSGVTIERYSFSLSDDFILGTAAAFPATFSGTPDTTFRPQIITANAPANGFAYLSNLKMANVDVTIGPGEEDLFGISSGAWGRTMDMPTLSTSNRARAQGRTTLFVPPGYPPGSDYTLCLNFKGPANLAGGVRNNL